MALGYVTKPSYFAKGLCCKSVGSDGVDYNLNVSVVLETTGAKMTLALNQKDCGSYCARSKYVS
jgi:hypothetical protein